MKENKKNLAKLAMMGITGGMMLTVPENICAAQAKYNQQTSNEDYQPSIRGRRYTNESEQGSCRSHGSCSGKHEHPATSSCHGHGSCSGKSYGSYERVDEIETDQIEQDDQNMPIQKNKKIQPQTTNQNKQQNTQQNQQSRQQNYQQNKQSNTSYNTENTGNIIRKTNKSCGGNGGCGGKGGCGHSTR